jgi:hypothetical protein
MGTLTICPHQLSKECNLNNMSNIKHPNNWKDNLQPSIAPNFIALKQGSNPRKIKSNTSTISIQEPHPHLRQRAMNPSRARKKVNSKVTRSSRRRKARERSSETKISSAPS